MARFRNVFFDLDGTLIDHFVAIHKAFSWAAIQSGLPAPSFEKVKKTVGGSVPITTSRLFPGKEVEPIIKHFRQHFSEVMFDGLEILPGVGDMLETLDKIGCRSIVFTNKNGINARKVCDYLGLSQKLHAIVGTGDTPYMKPDKAFSEYMLERFNSTPSNSCMVGDSPFDEQSARCVGMECYLVATGSHDVEALMEHCESPVFASMNELQETKFYLSPLKDSQTTNA
jgi:phosphoglycolate phosphatase